MPKTFYRIIVTNILRVLLYKAVSITCSSCAQWRTPPPEIPKAIQNRAKLNTIVKSVKNC